MAWQQLVVSFRHWQEALACAQELPRTAMNLNELCLLEAPVAARMPWPGGCLGPQAGEHRVILLAAPDTLPVLITWLQARGGTLRWRATVGKSSGLPLTELTWNHTTLHWRAQLTDWTYLQMLLPQPEGPCLEALRLHWGPDLLWHLEGVRQQGAQRLAALPLLRFQGEKKLYDLISHCTKLGALIFNPHVLSVEDRAVLVELLSGCLVLGMDLAWFRMVWLW